MISMKASLQLRVSHNLAMTPQLQQAIRLLQLSTAELQMEIQQALESNMMLELDEGNENERPDPYTEQDAPQNEEGEMSTAMAADIAEDIPEELPVDSAWDDIYDNSMATGNANNSDGPQFEN